MTHPRLVRARLAVALFAGWLGGCPGNPPPEGGPGASSEGGERPDPGDTVNAFADTALAPLATAALEQTAAAREPGDEPLALLLRADVATAAEDGALSFCRVGLLQLASGPLLLFELEPRAVTDDAHGHGPDELGDGERAVVAALEGTVEVLSPERCAALSSEPACEPLGELASASADPRELLAGPVVRVALGSSGLLVARGGETLLLESAEDGTRMTVLGRSPSE